MDSEFELAELRAEVAALRAEIDQADEFAGGILTLLLDLMPPLLRAQPALAEMVLPRWQRAAEKWDRLSEHTAHPDDEDETAGNLEARKMLYRLLQKTGGLPPP